MTLAEGPTAAPYQALVVLSFGGPEAPEEVWPFLERVTAGRRIPPGRLERVAEHYLSRGGVSPINAESRRLVEALTAELVRRGLDLPVVLGNRNAAPFLGDTLADLATEGINRVVCLTTSAYPSYSSCRQYRENLHDALPSSEFRIDRIRQYANHPGFVAAATDTVLDALRTFDGKDPVDGEDPVRLVFVTHSIPVEMAECSGPPPRPKRGAYVTWHESVAAAVTRAASRQWRSESRQGGSDLAWDLAYCSRSGRPGQPWLEPDINDHLETLAGQGVRRVVLVPIGFTADHLEVVQDLDTEAMATAARLGLTARRAATVRTHPEFVTGLVDLVLERAAVARGESVPAPVIAGEPAGLYHCPQDCCTSLSEPGRPAIGGA